MRELIRLRDIYGTMLKSREIAREVFAMPEILESNSVSISFAGIEFVSRSFVDHFSSELQRVKEEHGGTVEVIEMNPDVSQFFSYFKNRELKTSDPGPSLREQAVSVSFLQLRSM